jgi:hypothetical protein
MAKKAANKQDIRIVILQRGWVFVGRYVQVGEDCALTDAKCVRRWGTTKGLGELAANGPLPNTVLDSSPDVRFHILTVIATIDCAEDKWARVLAG